MEERKRKREEQREEMIMEGGVDKNALGDITGAHVYINMMV